VRRAAERERGLLETSAGGTSGDAEWRTRVEQTLAATGYNSTLPRRLMIAWVAAAEGPFSAEALVAALERQRGGT
jgi:Fe2+ or Zn2+ uptake regulation protein